MSLITEEQVELQSIEWFKELGYQDEEDDGIPFEEKINSLSSELIKTQKMSQELDNKIASNLRKIGITSD